MYLLNTSLHVPQIILTSDIFIAVRILFRYSTLNLTRNYIFLLYNCIIFMARGGVVVKALRYKPAGRGFDSRWCHWNFSVT